MTFLFLLIEPVLIRPPLFPSSAYIFKSSFLDLTLSSAASVLLDLLLHPLSSMLLTSVSSQLLSLLLDKLLFSWATQIHKLVGFFLRHSPSHIVDFWDEDIAEGWVNVLSLSLLLLFDIFWLLRGGGLLLSLIFLFFGLGGERKTGGKGSQSRFLHGQWLFQDVST